MKKRLSKLFDTYTYYCYGSTMVYFIVNVNTSNKYILLFIYLKNDSIAIILPLKRI